jgi:dihydrofolate reductase
MMLSMIAAMARNRVIGVDGRLPWRLRDDLRLFKKHTTGHAVIMGRKTFDTLPAPLPGRTNIVLTRHPGLQVPPGVVMVHSIDEALLRCQDDPEPFIVGGGEIYRLFLPRAGKIYLTTVDLEPDGDATFPELDESWVSTHREHFRADERNEAAFVFEILERSRKLTSRSV